MSLENIEKAGGEAVEKLSWDEEELREIEKLITKIERQQKQEGDETGASSAEELLDRIKKIVENIKKEYYTEGEHWDIKNTKELKAKEEKEKKNQKIKGERLTRAREVAMKITGTWKKLDKKIRDEYMGYRGTKVV